ncbi:MAG: ribulose-phosphate 3-epimerase [Acidimicrobiales bacterium]
MTATSAQGEPRIVPSVLPADFSRFGEACVELEKAGVDRLQFDVMDGRFVPNLTFGADVIASLRSWVELPFEAHLMIEDPDLLAPGFVAAGCELVIVHAEACRHLHRSLAVVRDAGGKAAVALNPATPVEAVQHVLDLVDLVLVMTVNPGFGGQQYLASMEPKVAQMRALLDAHARDSGHRIDLEVDGGVGPATIAGASRAGADVFIAGTALFRDPLGLSHAVDDLRQRAISARG